VEVVVGGVVDIVGIVVDIRRPCLLVLLGAVVILKAHHDVCMMRLRHLRRSPGTLLPVVAAAMDGVLKLSQPRQVERQGSCHCSSAAQAQVQMLVQLEV
jgi:hypothetical protein